MRRFIRMAMAAVFLFSMLGVWPSHTHAQGNVNGNVYTSPNFDYQLQWPEPWVFIEEDSTGGTDFLVISSGTSDATFFGVFAPGLTLDDFLEVVLAEPVPEVTDFGPMLDAQGVPIRGFNGDQEWALYSGNQQLADGSSIQFMQYFNVRPLGGGVALAMTGTTVSYFWDDATSLQGWHDLANTIVVGGNGTSTTGPVPGPTATSTINPTPTVAPPIEPTPTDTTSAPEPTATTSSAPPLPDGDTRNGGGAGESAPAFAAGPWRVAARAVDIGETIDYLGLGFVEGQQWIVAYVDVTNWSDAEAQLDIASWQLATTSGPIAPDVAGTQSAASSLGLEPANGSSVTVPAGGSVRLALVYSIPASETELVLQIGDAQLPLEDAVGTQLDVTDLSTIAKPPSVESGTVRTLPDDGSGVPTFVVDTGSGELPIQLAGVNFTPPSDCTPIAGAALEIKVEGVSGPVWLETDPSIPEQDTYYVWIEDESGNRVLLNQFLIASGLGFEGDVPEAARFGAWLEQSEEVARSNGIGIWQLCA